MIKITFYIQDNHFVGVLSKGHANYDDYGKDIVCSAVSAITQSLALGVLDVLKVKAEYKVDDNAGYLELRLPKLANDVLDKTEILFDTAYRSVSDLAKGYPSNIKVEVKDL